ncbi:Lrp/AsnC family transcriptional regulator [Halorientalis regularis]|jgi:Lrp/AsnC family leucine-responsive transcriptional regulator|uniref:DNA-binding transcriptional regulator, Lrp family n=1 Tax=Halorientalis regularis TaxID=660518 RepID=A0A1G7J5P8_9EURY|nr:Lrp/AsnC family transcriptional regulator [Halorientalis regularis]SDF20223.1 DNA-binding transcriptional regulator, Lrp family [Halorientalis regularis]
MSDRDDIVELDALDRHIIYRLQHDARNTSASTIADEMDVAASTVRNRINRLEEQGVIKGYYLDVDYERAGFQLHTLIVCNAEIPDREKLSRQALEIEGVVAVREVMTGSENVHVEVVGRDGDDLSRIGQELDALGLEVVDEDIIRNEYVHAYEGFSPES